MHDAADPSPRIRSHRQHVAVVPDRHEAIREIRLERGVVQCGVEAALDLAGEAPGVRARAGEHRRGRIADVPFGVERVADLVSQRLVEAETVGERREARRLGALPVEEARRRGDRFDRRRDVEQLAGGDHAPALGALQRRADLDEAADGRRREREHRARFAGLGEPLAGRVDVGREQTGAVVAALAAGRRPRELSQSLDDERPFEHVEGLAGGVHGGGVSNAPSQRTGPAR